MQKRLFLRGAAAALAFALAFPAFADRVVTDQTGRSVTIPDPVNCFVVLQHQTLNLLVQMNASVDYLSPKLTQGNIIFDLQM